MKYSPSTNPIFPAVYRRYTEQPCTEHCQGAGLGDTVCGTNGDAADDGKVLAVTDRFVPGIRVPEKEVQLVEGDIDASRA
jgi:hypothetical protein